MCYIEINICLSYCLISFTLSRATFKGKHSVLTYFLLEEGSYIISSPCSFIISLRQPGIELMVMNLLESPCSLSVIKGYLSTS